MNWGRALLIVALAAIAYTLLEYAPLVPKTIMFMDDVHMIRVKAVQYEKLAIDIKDAIARVEKKFSFFEQQEKDRRGR